MDNIKLVKIEKILQQGQWRYILFRGVFGWGVITAILFSLWQYFMGAPQALNLAAIHSVAINFVLFPVAGIFWGAAMWMYLKKQYEKYHSI